MKTTKLFAILLFVQLFINCDPPHYMDFINKTDENVKVKLNINPKIENYDLKRFSIGDSIVFNIKPKDTANLHFGIGDWSDHEIEEVTKTLKSIEIETENIKTIYKSKKAMQKILKENRHGFWFKTIIKIEIK